MSETRRIDVSNDPDFAVQLAIRSIEGQDYLPAHAIALADSPAEPGVIVLLMKAMIAPVVRGRNIAGVAMPCTPAMLDLLAAEMQGQAARLRAAADAEAQAVIDRARKVGGL